MHDLYLTLGKELWNLSVPVQYGWYRKFVEKFPDLPRPSTEMLTQEHVRTHGDPTLANLMLRRETGEHVLIDAMPPRDYLPSLRCVDVGKLLQSCCGWEILLGADFPEQNIPPHGREDIYWLGVHGERIRRRETSKDQPRESIVDWATQLRDGSMELYEEMKCSP